MLRKLLSLFGFLAVACPAFAQSVADTAGLRDVRIETPDSAVNRLITVSLSQLRTGWGQGANTPANAAAMTAAGRFDAVRARLSQVLAAQDAEGGIENFATEFWLFVLYDYWAASGDDAFIKRNWPAITRALTWAAAHDTTAADAFLGSVRVAALDGVERMADALNDRVTQKRAAAMATSAQQRSERLPAQDSAGAGSPFTASFTSLVAYQSHNAKAGYEGVQHMAQGVSSGTTPLLRASGALLSLLRGLIGWNTDAGNHAALLESHLPGAWNVMRITNLRVGRDRLEVTMTRERHTLTINVERMTKGVPLTMRVAPALPAGAILDRVIVDDRDELVQAEETQRDLHAVAEITLMHDAEIIFQYSPCCTSPAKRARQSPSPSH